MAVLTVVVRNGDAPLRMNDYAGTGIGQSIWPVGQQEFLVMPVPAFNQPVRIREVELRTVYSTGQFDHADAYFLAFSPDRFYGHFMGRVRVMGLQLTTDLQPDDTAGSVPEALDSRPVQKLDNHLSIVIPVNIHEPGCHEAQVVFHVTTSDGARHVLGSRWYVAVDTGVSDGDGEDMCERSRPAAGSTSPSPDTSTTN